MCIWNLVFRLEIQNTIYYILHTNPMEPKIISADKDLLVLDKPTGWIVNDSETTKDVLTIQDWLKDHFTYEIVANREYRSGIVHRLDKETSGILVIAKNPETFRFLQSQFKKRLVEKKYLALVHGRVTPMEGKIEAPVGRLAWNKKRFGVLPGGRSAVTYYKTTKNYDDVEITKGIAERFTLLELSPKTGRTHQIRIHMKYLGHPVVSDEFYAGRKRARADRIWCKRLFLHAQSIAFTSPENGKTVRLTSKLPLDLENALNSLEKLL